MSKTDHHGTGVIRGDKPQVIEPGHVSDDPIDQGRYDALFASTGPGLESSNGLAPSAGNSAVTRVWLEDEDEFRD